MKPKVNGAVPTVVGAGVVPGMAKCIGTVVELIAVPAVLAPSAVALIAYDVPGSKWVIVVVTMACVAAGCATTLVIGA